jgi:hypothetical protein
MAQKELLALHSHFTHVTAPKAYCHGWLVHLPQCGS